MLEECTNKPHDYKSVHEGLVGGQTLVQCQNCKTISVMWSNVLKKEQTTYKEFVEVGDKDGGLVKNVRAFFKR